MMKNHPAVQESRIRCLGWEGLQEKAVAAPAVFLPGESGGCRSPAGHGAWGHRQPDRLKRLGTRAQGLSSCGSQALELRLGSCGTLA